MADLWAQRWRRGRDVWLADHPHAPRLDPTRYRVEPVAERAARTWTLDAHYSGTWPAVIRSFALIDVPEDRIVGTAVFSAPTTSAVLTNALPSLRPYVESMELGRFVCDPSVPANGESWFLSRVLKLLKQDGVRGIVSFADPVPRHLPDGTLVKPGHHGGIYAALSATYTGRGTPRTLKLLTRTPGTHGPADRGAVTVLSDRTISKIRAEDKGAAYGVRLLVDHGAPPPDGEALRDWLPTAMTAAGVTRLRHPGNHRWILTTDPRVPLGMDPQPRPKPEGPPTAPTTAG